MRSGSCYSPHFVIPAKAGLRRQDAEANIREADGPQGNLQEAGCHPFCFGAQIERKNQNQNGSRLSPG
jgi:hypothetical protein